MIEAARAKMQAALLALGPLAGSPIASTAVEALGYIDVLATMLEQGPDKGPTVNLVLIGMEHLPEAARFGVEASILASLDAHGIPAVVQRDGPAPKPGGIEWTREKADAFNAARPGTTQGLCAIPWCYDIAKQGGALCDAHLKSEAPEIAGSLLRDEAEEDPYADETPEPAQEAKAERVPAAQVEAPGAPAPAEPAPLPPRSETPIQDTLRAQIEELKEGADRVLHGYRIVRYHKSYYPGMPPMYGLIVPGETNAALELDPMVKALMRRIWPNGKTETAASVSTSVAAPKEDAAEDAKGALYVEFDLTDQDRIDCELDKAEAVNAVAWFRDTWKAKNSGMRGRPLRAFKAELAKHRKEGKAHVMLGYKGAK